MPKDKKKKKTKVDALLDVLAKPIKNWSIEGQKNQSVDLTSKGEKASSPKIKIPSRTPKKTSASAYLGGVAGQGFFGGASASTQIKGIRVTGGASAYTSEGKVNPSASLRVNIPIKRKKK